VQHTVFRVFATLAQAISRTQPTPPCPCGLILEPGAAELSALSRNFHSLTRESTALVLFFYEFIGLKAADLTRIEHTTARRLSHAFRTGGAPVISFSWLQ
jgi:hypothetical protein